MRLIAFALALFSFTTGLATVVGVAGHYVAPFHGAVLTVCALALTVFWVSVAQRH